MSGSALSAKFFHDEADAYTKLESLLWPDGPVCPRCGCLDRITVVSGKTARMGLKRCSHCKRQFTVTVGTVYESSHVKLNLWLQASHLLSTSKKGMSSHQIHRTLGVTYKTAWFMTHRLREAMRSGELTPLGGPVVLSKRTKLSSDAKKELLSVAATATRMQSCLSLTAKADRSALSMSMAPARPISSRSSRPMLRKKPR